LISKIKENHFSQTLRYRFDIQFGYKLRNIETGSIETYYPGENTSYFESKEKPLINTSIDYVIDDIYFSYTSFT
jgi:hypothetical protein